LFFNSVPALADVVGELGSASGASGSGFESLGGDEKGAEHVGILEDAVRWEVVSGVGVLTLNKGLEDVVSAGGVHGECPV